MDNHYVPNLTIGPAVAAAIKPHCVRADGAKVPLDVHLMVQPVDALAQAFCKAGADLVSFHPDASTHVDRTLQLIKAEGRQAGLVFNPATPLDVLEWVIDKVDLVLIMSVNPGFGGQSFIDSALRKIEQARRLIDASGPRHPAGGRRRHQGRQHPPRGRRRRRHLRGRQRDLRPARLQGRDRRDARRTGRRAGAEAGRVNRPMYAIPGSVASAPPRRARCGATPAGAHRGRGAGAEPGRIGDGRTRPRPRRPGAGQAAHPRHRRAAGDRQAAPEPGPAGRKWPIRAEPAHELHRQPRHRQDHGGDAHGRDPAPPGLRAERATWSR